MKFATWLENDESEIVGWIGNSVIKHPVYHGTNKDFSQFDYQKSTRRVLFTLFDVETKGFFFTENLNEAFIFGNKVAVCYIRLANPLLNPHTDKNLGVDRLPEKKELDIAKILTPMIEKQGDDSFFDLGVERIWINNPRYEFPHQWIYNAIAPTGIHWDIIDNPQVVQNMKNLGYDGSFVYEPELKNKQSIFVMSPDQIKIIKWISK